MCTDIYFDRTIVIMIDMGIKDYTGMCAESVAGIINMISLILLIDIYSLSDPLWHIYPN